MGIQMVPKFSNLSYLKKEKYKNINTEIFKYTKRSI